MARAAAAPALPLPTYPRHPCAQETVLPASDGVLGLLGLAAAPSRKYFAAIEDLGARQQVCVCVCVCVCVYWWVGGEIPGNLLAHKLLLP
jgi:hypothetical protein